MKEMIRSRTFLTAGVMAALLVAGAAFGQETRDMHEMMQQPQRSEFYRIFTSFWWLLFPLGWAIGQLVKNFLRHARAKEALSVMKSYADQGKDPPAELVTLLRQPQMAEEAVMARWNYRHYGWIPVFLFGALSAGFVLFALFPINGMPPVAMLFVAIIMAGLCIGNVVAMLVFKNRDRAPPP